MNFILTRTPLRISFFGGGSDYSVWFDENRGAVLSTTIDKYIYLSCRYLPPFFGMNHRIVWRHVELVTSISDILHPAIREGLKYLNFNDNTGVEIHYQADLPARSGMGSSSSFVVGMLSGLSMLQSQRLSKKQLADTALDLELNWMQEAVGCQDQVAASYGGFNRIEFSKGNQYEVYPVPISKERKNNFLSNLMLFFIGANRDGVAIAETIIQNIPNRTSHLERMVGLVDKAEHSLVSGNIDDIGEMLAETWSLKRELSDKVSSDTIDDVYNAARLAGARGGKLLGAGGTGFLLLFVPPEKHRAVREILSNDYMEIAFSFEEAGSTISADQWEN